MSTGGTSAQPSSRTNGADVTTRVERVDREIHFGATLVVSVADSATQALTDEARALGWPLIAARRPGEVLRAMWRAPALLVSLVHVAEHEPALADDAAEIVRGVRTRRPELPLIGVTPVHAASLERRLREAGATCYVAGDLRGCADVVAAAIAARIDRAVFSPAPRGAAHLGLSPPGPAPPPRAPP